MTSKNRKTPIPEWRAVSSLWTRNRGFFGVFGAPGGIRTHGLPLRRTKNCSPLRAFECPGMPYFTGFLTNVGVRISLEYTPQIPGCR